MQQLLRKPPWTWWREVRVLVFETPSMIMRPLQLLGHFPFEISHIEDVEFANAYPDFFLFCSILFPYVEFMY